MRFLLTAIYIGLTLCCSAQFYNFNLTDSIEVNDGTQNLKNPWVGGINAAQVSTIELNGDFLPDLFIFDRTDNKILTYINEGGTGTPNYKYAPEYADVFPKELRHWCILRDYNCDGLKDIWSYTSGGIQVYKNTGTPGNVQFTKVSDLVLSLYDTSLLNLYVSSTDIPSIDDVDGDGDLDVVTFSILGANLEYHRNLSVETYGTCDSLNFHCRNFCWGHFSESFTTNALQLYDTCDNSNLGVPAEFIEDNRFKEELFFTKSSAARHSGSTVMTIDEDGDGVKDVLIGDVSYPVLAMLTNGGSAPNANSSMSAQDTTFPSYNVPVDVKIFPAAFYEDVSNDGKRDLIVGTNTANQSIDVNSVFYYVNTGTDANPVFSFQQDDLLQEDMIDVGTGAIPTLFDHNADGLPDIILSNFGIFDTSAGEFSSSVSLYENTGTISKPEFTLITNDYMGLSTSGIELNMIPTFGDLDGDNDPDMIIGDFDGRLHYFTNTAGPGNTANFVLTAPQLTDTDGFTIDVGLHAAPELYDTDGDGDLDLIIGERNGNLNYFENNSSTSPSFSHITDSLGFIRVQYLGTTVGMSVPRFFKNASGETQLFVGTEAGHFEHFANIDGNLTGSFTQVDTMVGQIDVGLRSVPAVADLNGDNFPDLVIGNKRGGLNIGMGEELVISVEEVSELRFEVYPNPADDLLNIHLPNQSQYLIRIVNSAGQLIKKSAINGNRAEINVSDMSAGFYLVQIISEQGVGAKPIIVR